MWLSSEGRNLDHIELNVRGVYYDDLNYDDIDTPISTQDPFWCFFTGHIKIWIYD